MNYDRGFAFIGGLILGGIVGAVAALLMAPASGKELRKRLGTESIELKQQGQTLRHDTLEEAQKLVRQGQKSVSDVQARFGSVLQNRRDHLQEAVDAGKQAVSHRKQERVNRFEEVQAPEIFAPA